MALSLETPMVQKPDTHLPPRCRADKEYVLFELLPRHQSGTRFYLLPPCPAKVLWVYEHCFITSVAVSHYCGPDEEFVAGTYTRAGENEPWVRLAEMNI